MKCRYCDREPTVILYSPKNERRGNVLIVELDGVEEIPLCEYHKEILENSIDQFIKDVIKIASDNGCDVILYKGVVEVKDIESVTPRRLLSAGLDLGRTVERYRNVKSLIVDLIEAVKASRDSRDKFAMISLCNADAVATTLTALYDVMKQVLDLLRGVLTDRLALTWVALYREKECSSEECNIRPISFNVLLTRVTPDGVTSRIYSRSRDIERVEIFREVSITYDGDKIGKNVGVRLIYSNGNIVFLLVPWTYILEDAMKKVEEREVKVEEEKKAEETPQPEAETKAGEGEKERQELVDQAYQLVQGM